MGCVCYFFCLESTHLNLNIHGSFLLILFSLTNILMTPTQGLLYIHELNIVHLDIKPYNILFSEKVIIIK